MKRPIYIGAEPLAQLQRQGVRVTTLTDFKALPDDVQLVPEVGDWVDRESVMRSAKRLDTILNGGKSATTPLLIDVVSQLEKDLPVLLEIAAMANDTTRSYPKRMKSRLEKIKHLLQGD